MRSLEKTTFQARAERDAIAKIQRIVARHCQIPIEEMLSPNRVPKLANARHLGMYLCRKTTTASLLQIAQAFGRVDHISTTHAIKVVEERMSIDAPFAIKVASVRGEVEAVPEAVS